MAAVLWFEGSSTCVLSGLFKGRFVPVSCCLGWDFCTMSQRTARSPSESRECPKSWPARMQLVPSILLRPPCPPPRPPRPPVPALLSEMEARTDLQQLQTNTPGADVLLLLSVSIFPPITESRVQQRKQRGIVLFLHGGGDVVEPGSVRGCATLEARGRA